MNKLKKSGILALLFCAVVFCHSQNWEPITWNETFHFRNDTSDVIVTSLKVDSVGVENGDSVWYLNRMMKELVPLSLWTKNGGRFLQKKMFRFANGVRNFQDPGNFNLFTQDSIGSTWLFDSLNSITAFIGSAGIGMVFGQTDSIKEISLSSGDIVVLSKEHGLLRFPTQYSSGHFYQLSGITGRNLGELLPGFHEIYDYSPGDYFLYRIKGIGWGGPSDFHEWDYHLSIRIDSVRSSHDTMTVFINSSQDGAFTLIDSVSNFFNFLPNEAAPICPNRYTIIGQDNYQDCDPASQWNNPPSIASPSFSRDARGRLQISTTQFYLTPGNPYYQFQPYANLNPSGSDTVFADGTTQNYVFAEGLGMIYHDHVDFESAQVEQLVYCIKGGVTIYPDIFLDRNGYWTLSRINFEIFPNPASDKITLRIKNSPHTTATLVDLQGKEILNHEFSGSETEIKLTGIPAGIYFLRVNTNAGTATKKIMISGN